MKESFYITSLTMQTLLNDTVWISPVRRPAPPNCTWRYLAPPTAKASDKLDDGLPQTYV